VFFRADNFVAAKSLLVSMTGALGLTSNLARIHVDSTWFTIVPLLFVVWFFPNTHQLLARYEPTLEYAEKHMPEVQPVPVLPLGIGTRDSAAMPGRGWLRGVRAGVFQWRPSWPWAVAVSALAVCSIVGLSRIAEFIYWQF
jgi:hypothetical protein